MSEREQHMDTDKRTGTSGQCGNTDEMRWDLGTLFPAKGDPRRPPEWLGRALLYIAIAIVLLSFCWRSWGKIEYLIIDVVISLFLALAVEPVVIPLVKHGWEAFVRFDFRVADVGCPALRDVRSVRQSVRAAGHRFVQRSAGPLPSRSAISWRNTRISSFLRSTVSAVRF